MPSIKETKEVLDFSKYAIVKVLEAAKDGLDWTDLKVLLDGEMLSKGKTAIEGASQIPAELKDLEPEEIKDLAAAGIDIAWAIIGALKK